MTLNLKTEAPPLRPDGTGGLRIGKSRVLLEVIIRAFENGATPETLVQQYSTTTLADIYSVIGYYLRHKSEIEAYIAERDEQAYEVRSKVESRQKDLTEIRQRLQAHRQ